MAKVVINHERCKGCLLCLYFCPKRLLVKSEKLNKKGVNFVQVSSGAECAGCLQCTLICPDCCIEVYK